MIAETTAKIKLLKSSLRKKPLRWSEDKLSSIERDISDLNTEISDLEANI